MKTIQQVQSAIIAPGLTILVLFNATVLLAGQFASLAPFIALSALALWATLPRAAWRTWDCWLWLAFLVLVAAQFQGIGTTALHDYALSITFPARRWLPFTLYWRETVAALAGWLAVSAFALAYRERSDEVERLVLWLAVALAVLGIVQHHTGAAGFFWMIPYPRQFFSVFGYINNAGTWFMLAGALALHRSWRNLPLCGLFFYCIWLCDCRAMLPVIPLLIAVKSLRRASVMLVPVALAGFWLVADEVMADRWADIEANVRLWLRFPWLGVGCTGNLAAGRIFVKPYLREVIEGSSMTHCDALVFGVEYGLVGLALLATIAARAIRGIRWGSVAGVAVVCAGLHSMIDMPFRCPAVLLMMLVLVHAGRRPRPRVSLCGFGETGAAPKISQPSSLPI